MRIRDVITSGSHDMCVHDYVTPNSLITTCLEIGNSRYITNTGMSSLAFIDLQMTKTQHLFDQEFCDLQ